MIGEERYQSGTSGLKELTDDSGTAALSFRIGRATIGYPMAVSLILVARQTYQTITAFTLHERAGHDEAWTPRNHGSNQRLIASRSGAARTNTPAESP
jgi:hypothetical protein